MLYPLHITRVHILHVPQDEHISLLWHKIKGFWWHCRVVSNVSFTPKHIFGLQLLISLSTFRFSVTGTEQRVVAWRGFPSGDPHIGIWYRPLPSTRYWRFPWIAAAHGNVQRLSLRNCWRCPFVAVALCCPRPYSVAWPLYMRVTVSLSLFDVSPPLSLLFLCFFSHAAWPGPMVGVRPLKKLTIFTTEC